MKPFGFAIHECIDGYSRKIIWLEVASTNKDPSVVAGNFLKALKSIVGLPVRTRSDNGIDNGLVEAVKIAIKSHNTVMNMLAWEVVVLVCLQLIKELKAFGRNLQKTDHSGGDSSLRNFVILDLLKLEIQY